ncbi:MAG: hypothetical protein IK152_08370 [Lachnospiraceae bacterium]|nr:hypothetical protein [Lachnospiraceae bacterium]
MKKRIAQIMILMMISYTVAGCGSANPAPSSSSKGSSASTIAAQSSSSQSISESSSAQSSSVRSSSAQSSSSQWTKESSAGELISGDSSDVIAELKNDGPTVVFTAKKSVKNFRIVKLSAKFIDDDGHFELLYENANTPTTLNPDKPVSEKLEFGETIPTVGYMYTDATGKDRLFPMGLSGEDGSLIVWEYVF